MIHVIEMPTPYLVGNVNAILIKGDALSLVDVGVKTKEAYEVLKRGIKEAGYDMRDVEQVILTHHHPDHVGWVDAFPQAELLGHSYNNYWLKAEPAFLDYALSFYIEQLKLQGVPAALLEKQGTNKKPFDHVPSRPLTHILQDGDEIPGHPYLRAVYTPGHALSHFIYVHERNDWAIGGDLLLPHMTPNPLIEPPATQGEPRAKSFLDYNTSLQRLHDLHLSRLYPNHQEVILNPNELIEHRMERSKEQAQRLLALLTNKPQTAFELNAQYYASLYQKELVLTLSKTQGYLDYLTDLQFIKETLNEHGVFEYVLNK